MNMHPTRRLRLAGVVLGSLVGLFALLTAGGYALPIEAHVTTSVTLDSSSAELFPLFNSRNGHRRVWTQLSKSSGAWQMSLADLGGPDAGVGTEICFCLTGEGLGPMSATLSSLVRGHGIIVESVQDRRVVYEIDFGVVELRRVVELEALDGYTTRITWSETTRATGPLMRYLLLPDGPATTEGYDVVSLAAGEVARADRR